MGSFSLFRLFLLMILFLSGVTSGFAGEMRLPIGLGYSSNATKITDIYVSNIENRGYDVSKSPYGGTGIFFSPYYQADSGLGFGVTFGPTIFLLASNGSGDSYNFAYMGFGPDIRYAFLQGSNISPFAKVGLRYPFAGGKWVKGVTPGFFAGGGVEFFRTKRCGFGFEIGYDSSKIKIEDTEKDKTEKIQQGKITVAIYAVIRTGKN